VKPIPHRPTRTKTGTLFAFQDNILLEACTLEEALFWLRNFNGTGWHGGQTLWLSRGKGITINDATNNFTHLEPGA